MELDAGKIILSLLMLIIGIFGWHAIDGLWLIRQRIRAETNRQEAETDKLRAQMGKHIKLSDWFAILYTGTQEDGLPYIPIPIPIDPAGRAVVRLDETRGWRLACDLVKASAQLNGWDANRLMTDNEARYSALGWNYPTWKEAVYYLRDNFFVAILEGSGGTICNPPLETLAKLWPSVYNRLRIEVTPPAPVPASPSA